MATTTASISIASNIIPSMPMSYYKTATLTKSGTSTGLENLHNTCYMNAALQCLIHIYELSNYLGIRTVCTKQKLFSYVLILIPDKKS